MKLAVFFAAVVGLCAAVPAPQKKFNVTILEKGMLVEEKVEVRDGLQIYTVPEHHDLENVKMFVDFTNDIVVAMYPRLEKCQVSYIDVAQPNENEQQQGFEALKSYIAWAGNAVERNLAKVESPTPMEDTSFLRQEIQDACAGLPVYWADTVDVTGKTDESFMVPGGDPSAVLTPRQKRSDFFLCKQEHFNQKCKLRTTDGRNGACYYFVLCGGLNVDKSCLEHLRHGSVECTPCCTDPKSPTTGPFIRCDLLKW